MSAWLEQQLLRIWYQPKAHLSGPQYLIVCFLAPFSWLYEALAKAKKKRDVSRQQTLPVPVIVVGNIVVGGTGKTPLVLAIAEYLIAEGWQPGILSRGYRGAYPKDENHLVNPLGDASFYGDEALFLAKRSICPVVVGRDRYQSAKALIAQNCDVLISDDGLQHYRLPRDIEVVVTDGTRGFGNHALLPAGPLRESVGRLQSAHLLVCTEGDLQGMFKQLLAVTDVFDLKQNQVVAIADLPSPLKAIAGIGNPDRFFQTLSNLGLAFDAKAFPDHHAYSAADFADANHAGLIMTDKDAVKLRSMLSSIPVPCYTLRVKSELPEAFWKQFNALLEAYKNG